MKRFLFAVVAILVAMCGVVAPVAAQGGTIGGSTGGGNAVVTDSLKRLANGSAAAPSLAFLNSTTTGLYRFGADTLGIATGGAASLFVSGGASAKLGNAAGNNWDLMSGANAKLRITSTGIQSIDTLVLGAGVMRGGAGNMTIRAGTGNSRTMLLQATNGSGTATTAITVKFDTVRVHDEVVLPSLSAASGTPNSVCMDATSKQVTENAATSCVVSAARFKSNIIPLSLPTASRIVTQLVPQTFTYRSGGRRAIGLIAEQADTVDHRLATRNANGQINSVNYEQVTIVLLKVVQEQQRRLDAMCKTGYKAAC
jgi:hypothetical protein